MFIIGAGLLMLLVVMVALRVAAPPDPMVTVDLQGLAGQHVASVTLDPTPAADGSPLIHVNIAPNQP